MVISGNGRVCAGQMVHIQMVHMVNKDIAAFFWRGGDSLWEIFSNHLYGPADIWDLSWSGDTAAGRVQQSVPPGGVSYHAEPARYTYNYARQRWERTYLSFGNQGAAAGISADGNIIVGWVRRPSARWEIAFWWTPQGGVRLLPKLRGDLWNGALKVSADGRIIVGRAQVVEYGPQRWRAVRWVDGVVEDLNQTYQALLQDSSVLYDVRQISLLRDATSSAQGTMVRRGGMSGTCWSSGETTPLGQPTR